MAKDVRPAARGRSGDRARTATRIRFELGRDVQKNLKQLPATIRVTATRAGSWLRHPAPVVKELDPPVRLTPPSLAVVSTFTYVTQGGCEAVVYRVGETSVKDGVSGGSMVLPRIPAPGGGPQDRFALFAVPYDVSEPSQVKLIATDEVGNSAIGLDDRQVLPATAASRHDSARRCVLPQGRVPSILSQTPELTDKGDLLANYLQINRDLRKIDNAELVALAKSSPAEVPLDASFSTDGLDEGDGPFRRSPKLRLPRKSVDQQDHLGLDMAGVSRAPVPAANDGVVVLAKFFGIYGNAIVVDHGYGLMSLYGHLSAIDVKEGQTVTARPDPRPHGRYGARRRRPPALRDPASRPAGQPGRVVGRALAHRPASRASSGGHFPLAG